MNITSLEVEKLLARSPGRLPLSEGGFQREGGCPVDVEHAATLFPGARNSRAALAGLLLRLGCWAESHTVAQELHSAEGSYWHAITHRMEPDSANAAYWFRKAGQHVIFPELLVRAAEILKDSDLRHWRLKSTWDPFLFIEWCDEAREKRGELESAAQAIQMAEWELLFAWCAEARPVLRGA